MKKRQQKKKPQPPNKQNNSNTLRIIAGQWRGRKLSFATAPGLRPTPDRVREMLFNWLQGHLVDARGLDLFAGSGALGFEALSRGIAHVTLVENNRAAAANLQENIQLLKTDQAELIPIDAFQYLENLPRAEKPHQAFDLIFLDPPYRKNLLPKLVDSIRGKKLLAPNGLLYLEHEKEEVLEISLKDFELIKEKTTGQVVSKLLRRL